MATLSAVPPDTFESIQNVNIDQLSSLSEAAIRSILPCLVRMSLCHPLDTSEKWTKERKKILKCLSGIEVVNSLVGLLSIDFHALELDAKKEQQMRHMKESPKGEFYHKNSELFEGEVYLDEVSDVLCIAQAELPGLLPVTEVAEILLHVENGPWLLSRLIANVPDTFHEVCVSLVTRSELIEEGDVGVQRRTDTLKVLCDMCPAQALIVRQLCVDNCKLPGLAISLTLQHSRMRGVKQRGQGEPLNEVVAFVSGLLFGNDEEVRKWFAQYVKMSQKKPDSETMLHPLRQEILGQLMKLLPSGPAPCTLSDEKVVHSCVFIRLYCALKGLANLRLKDDEIEALVSLVTCRPSPSASGIRFICLSLCTLLAFPYLISSLENERQAADWIKWLVQDGIRFERMSGGKASFGEMLLLFAIYFHTNQNALIARLVGSTLGIQGVLVKANSLTKMRSIFTQEIFTEQVVATHAVRVPVTIDLSTSVQGCLPANCVHQLIESRAFSKHKVPVKNWIYKQLCECTTPLHPIVQPLIKTFVDSVVVANSRTDLCNEPITESEVERVFVSCDLTPQLLILYYVLLYQDVRTTHMKQIIQWERNVPCYSQQLLSTLPMKSLLQHAQENQHLYADLFPSMLKLLVSHYPHLCLVEDWLDESIVETMPPSALVSLPDYPCTPENLSEAFEQHPEESSRLLVLLLQLSVLSPHDLLPYVNIFTSNLHKLLEPNTARRIQDTAKTVWLKCHTICPATVRVKTVNSLSRRPLLSAFSEDDITLDPLIVLRCDPRLFRCPPLMEVNLRILEGFLQASRSYLAAQMKMQSSSEKTEARAAGNQANKAASSAQEELKTALIAAQESAAVQILLEACLPKPQENEFLLSNLREVRCLVCIRLHQMFIADPTLAKLVHFQGYASELLPVLVAGIPSMHICMDFISELLSQPHTQKRVFAIELVSYLSVQYALPKSLGIARLAVNVMSTLIRVLPSKERADFFTATVPAVARIARAFPPLCDDIVSLLLQIGQICRSHLASFNNSCSSLDVDNSGFLPMKGESSTGISDLSKYSQLLRVVYKTFEEICQSTTLLKQMMH
ncbi:hypothetical protein CAPTEDRAFT_226349 [Capitella teleta]|uniref:Integrator complex subunit 2 n=1 Tax=Capitella teleta TaxID=283909 RepID=R7U4F7_CAPTE|nr:hypothetical protein CAPTEDRAFT_226349 [Capitella teleta]|eukprot:ELT98571.1 hypothetical protein CAPTEDRAFT_226349 [Capitella teleta]